MARHNPFDDTEIAIHYEEWYQSVGLSADRQEKFLIRSLIKKCPKVNSILEVGCGSGHFTRWFKQLGLQAVGLDISNPMLVEARRLGGLVYLRGDALKLPFLSHSFDLTVMITTLEFINDPIQALIEALRVSRQGMVVGVINARSCLGRQYKRRGGPIWEKAQLFSPCALKEMILGITGKKSKIIWRTTLWPCWPEALPISGGGFIGMLVRLPVGKDNGDE